MGQGAGGKLTLFFFVNAEAATIDAWIAGHCVICMSASSVHKPEAKFEHKSIALFRKGALAGPVAFRTRRVFSGLFQVFRNIGNNVNAVLGKKRFANHSDLQQMFPKRRPVPLRRKVDKPCRQEGARRME